MKKLLLLAVLAFYLPATAQMAGPWDTPKSYTVATLPASPLSGTVVVVTDLPSSPTGCGTGGGSVKGQCRWNGSSWDLVSGGGGGSSSPLTTKGDIYTRSASADCRLPVGTDGYIVTADSTQTCGIKWAATATTQSTPGDIGNLIAWYDAADALCSGVACTNGGTATTWPSHYARANNLLTSGCSGGATYNTAQINSLPALTFNGTGNCYTFATSIDFQNTYGNQLSAFVVLKLASTAARSTLLSGASNSFCYAFATAGGKEQTFSKCFAYDIVGTAASDTNWHVMNLTWTGTAVLQIGTSADGSGTGVGVTAVNTTVGRNSAGNSEYFNGEVAEIILYGRALSDYEVGVVQTYLRNKYGL